MERARKNKYLVDGHLVACPNRPKCICSEAFCGDSYVDPLQVSGSMEHQWKTLQDVILEIGGEIEEADDYFLHATFKSRLFRFVDDVICRQDAARNCIQVRSSSRVGYSDFGVNRKRVEELRKRLRAKIKETES